MDARRFIHVKSQNAFGVLGLLKFSQEQTDLTVWGGGGGGAGGGTWVNFCWVCTAGLSEPLPHYSLFCGQL